MSGSLLRRPLPSSQKKKDEPSDKRNFKKKLTILPAIKDFRKRHVFDIYDDGDQNLLKPLGPEPFFPKKSSNLQWSTKYQNAAKSRSVVGIIPDLSYPFDNLQEVDEDYNNYNDSRFVLENKYESLQGCKQNNQESVNIIEIESKDIPMLNERKPWRHALLEEEAKNYSDIFDQISRVNLMEVMEETTTSSPYIKEHQCVSTNQHPSDIVLPSKVNSTISHKSPSTLKKSLTRSVELARKLTEENLQSILKEAGVVHEKDEDDCKDWSSLYEVMREELQKELLLEIQHSSEQPIVYDEITWKEEYDKETANDQTKLNLKAQFLEMIPELPPRVIDVLTWVNLSFNDFMEVPDPLLQAKNVIYLNMRNNPLLSIPDGISNLKKLRYLNFSFCYLQEINPRLFDLHELEVLDLSYNDIRRLDNECKKFRCLRELILEGNRIRCLPKGFLQLNLSHLQIASNFLGKPFWKESCPVVIQSLTELCIDTLLNNEILAKETIESLFPVHISSTCCDYCNGHMSLGGVDVIKPVSEIFGAKNLPILFNVCSPTCRKQLLSASHVPRSEENSS